MKRAALAFCAGLIIFAQCVGAAGAAVVVEFVNASRATRCAEEDNVYVKVFGEGVASFRISAEHPPYIATVRDDSTAPDFTACDMSQDPRFSFTPRTLTLYEDADIRLVGHVFPSFWRPDAVEFVAGATVERGLHLVQLLKRGAQRDIEILVVYPADGYWRVKPLPPPALIDSAYGSSFLLGPIEEDTRPFVAIRRIVFDPATLTFSLEFRNETRGALRVAAATRSAVALALALDPALPAGRPFAALRSMFVTPAQADVALASGAGTALAPVAVPILEFSRFQATGARFGRSVPSMHNLSAPDLVFDAFEVTTSR